MGIPIGLKLVSTQDILWTALTGYSEPVKPTNDGTLLFELGGRDTADKDNSTLVSLGSVTVEDKTKAHPHGRTSNTSNRTSWRGSTGPKFFLQEDTLPVLKSKLRKLGLPVYFWA